MAPSEIEPANFLFVVQRITVRTQFILVAAGLITQPGRGLGTHAGGHIYDYISLVQPTCSCKGFISKKILLNNLPLSGSLLIRDPFVYVP
jgi:hypothetical protein